MIFRKCRKSIFLLEFLFLSCFGQYVNDDHLQTPIDPDSDNTYLRLIWDNGTEHYIRNWECPDGIWSEEFLEKHPPKCACVKGAFIMTKGLCDEGFEILTGNEHCYDIAKSLPKKFTPLTGRSGLKGRASTVFRKDAPYVARLISPTPTSSVNEAVHYIFRLNDPYDFSIYASLPDGTGARLGCLKGQEGIPFPPVDLSQDKIPNNGTGVGPIMQIAELPPCATEFRGPQPWCGEKDGPFKEYSQTIKVGSKWGPKSSGAGSPYPGSCGGKKGRKKRSPRVLGRTMTKLSGRTIAEKAANSETASAKPPPKCNPTDFDPKTIEPKLQTQTSVIEAFVDHVEYPPIPNDFHSYSLHQSEINDQSYSIVKALMDIHLGSGEIKNSSRYQITREDEIPAFRYIRMARIIMNKVCPHEDIPSFVLDFMTRIFRLMYLDIAAKFPYPEMLNNGGATNIKILEALNSCRDNIPDNVTIFIKNETCPDAGYIGANLTNGQIYLYGDNMTRIPEYASFDPSTMDMSLETIWKMMLLVHYYCSPNFTSPLYHSEFAVKYEAFFRNPQVLYRWYHPGPWNTIVEMILSAFNLRDFHGAIDRCVSTANAMSAYKHWLRRPADQLKWRPSFKSDEEKAIEEEVKKAAAAPTKGKSRSGRRKRYYFQNNIWDEKAYCLRNSKDVVTEVRSTSSTACPITNRPAWFQNTD